MILNESKNKRIVIKIGSSSLTSRLGDISRHKLERLVDEVVKLKDEGHEVLLVSSGAVAAGYRRLGCLNRPTSLAEKQAAASIGQGLLMESYSERFISHGYTASQILITRSDFSDRDRYHNARNTINVLLDRGIIPIVNENDTVTVERLKFGDNDTLSAKVAGLVDADQLIILSDIDGLYTDDPRKNPDAKLLTKVSEITPEIEESAGEPGSAVGTGGMRSKIDAVKIAMASGISSFLGNATSPDIIHKAVIGKARGTYFIPGKNEFNLDTKRQWIAFHSGPEGEIVVSNKAKKGIDELKSLYPTGIRYVSGHFKKGSVVRIKDLDGNEVGLGVSNYSSKQLIKIKGISRDELADVGPEEAINNNDLVCHTRLAVPIH
ncbi:glutamate 5-kinase [Fictibacillus sp. 23RED33]|uniref:glutamate 5-kinase n=1 Tax=Fictibacillus sp. 23RED33 TaxID=2745879 RepID=UPI0018CF5610|nr:glutamate 5-kinase [Fictibacillus sp. 23RED33]MBH0174956.1 glutamate 5-kinase [Fictibacillus sp. 23RED33]